MSVQNQRLLITNSPYENAKLLGVGIYQTEAVAKNDDSIRLCSKKIQCLKGILFFTVVGGTITSLALAAFATPTSAYFAAGGFGIAALAETYNFIRLKGHKFSLQDQNDMGFTQVYQEIEKLFEQYSRYRIEDFQMEGSGSLNNVTVERLLNDKYHQFKFTHHPLLKDLNVNIEVLADRISAIQYVPENRHAAYALKACQTATKKCFSIPIITMDFSDSDHKQGQIQQLGLHVTITEGWGHHSMSYKLTQQHS